jgi:hypothetical protein
VGPPFDPAGIEGLDRHEVFLTSCEAIFIFDSLLGVDALAPLMAEPEPRQAAAWRDYVAEPPRIAEEGYSLARREAPDEDLS